MVHIHDAWVEVDLAALRYNLTQVKSICGSGVRVMAVVKGNGFGHGYVEPARAFVEAGADYLGVTRLSEAIALRNGGMRAPILVFAPIQPENADEAIALGLDLTVDGVASAKAISSAALRCNTVANIHLKVDTGMSRLGIMPDDFENVYRTLKAMPGIHITGIYTHFASATAKDEAPTRQQIEAFARIHRSLRFSEEEAPLVHAANSAAFLRFPEARYNMVRIGTLLYGQYPGGAEPHKLILKPTWKLKARICAIKTLQPGAKIGYGGEHTVTRTTRTAVIPIGYADGFTMTAEGPVYRQSPLKLIARKFSRAPHVWIGEQKAPVLGRVSMQLTVIDVTDCLEVSIGDVVTVPALRLATNPDLPRVYLETL